MRAALAGPFLKLGDIKRISDWCSLKKNHHILKQQTWIDATWCNHTWLSLFNVSGEQQLCRMLCIIRLCFYHFFHPIHKIRLAGNNTAGWQGIYLVTFQNRDSKLCTPLKGNGNPSHAGNYINGINQKVQEQWTSKKKLCNVLMLILLPPGLPVQLPKNHKSHKNNQTHIFCQA